MFNPKLSVQLTRCSFVVYHKMHLFMDMNMLCNPYKQNTRRFLKKCSDPFEHSEAVLKAQHACPCDFAF